MGPSHRSHLQRRYFHPRYWPTWAALCAFWVLAFCPRVLRARIGDGAAWLRERLDRKRTRIILVNLELCYPHMNAAERIALAHAHLKIVTRALLDTSVLMFRSAGYVRSFVEVRGFERLLTMRDSGRPLILLSPHCAALEQGGIRLCLDAPGLTMIRRHKNPVMDWVVTRMRTRFGGWLFPHDASMLALVRAVRHGRWFYYLPDEDQGHPNAVFAPFKGVPKATVPVLGRLVKATGALLVPTRSALDLKTGRYVLYIEEPRPWPETNDAVADASALNALLEHLIDADPAQYLWTQKIFRTRPGGGTSLY